AAAVAGVGRSQFLKHVKASTASGTPVETAKPAYSSGYSFHPRFRPARGQRRRWVLRPHMLGIASAHFGSHVRPRAAPEAGQIARLLDRPVRRRQKLQGERNTVTYRRVLGKAEQLLHPDCEDCLAVFV